MNRIVQYWVNVPMSLSHLGLTQLAKDGGYDTADLKTGEFLLFINGPFNAFKLFGAGNTFAYHRNRSDRPLNARALMYAIQDFDGVQIEYTKALAQAVQDQLRGDVRSALARAQKIRDEVLDEVQQQRGYRRAARKGKKA